MFTSILKVKVRRPKPLLLLHQKLTLNPIELAWSEVKRYTKDKFNFGHVKELTCNGFTNVGPGEWKKLVDHVQTKVED